MSDPIKPKGGEVAGAAAGAVSGTVADPPLDDDGDKKRSRGLKEVQRTGSGLAKANKRLARAIASGFEEFYERDDKSARKKRDGSIKDIVTNWSRGLSKTLEKGADVPSDIADAFDTKAVRRQVRTIARLLSGPLGR